MEVSVRYATGKDGVPIAYAVFGAGMPLVIIDSFVGAGIDARVDRGGEEFYETLTAKRQVVLFDWRGCGLSGQAKDFTLEAFAADVETVVNQLGLSRFDIFSRVSPCHVALEFTALHPGSVRKLVLLNPSLKGDGPAQSDHMAPILHLAASDWEIFTEMYALRVAGWTERGRQLAEQLRRHWTSETFGAFMASVGTFDAFPRAASIGCDTLVLITADAVETETRRQAGQRLAGLLPKGRLVMSRDRTRSRENADQIEAFLAEGEGEPTAAAKGEDGRAAAGSGSSAVVILFTDIVESTALTERLGDQTFRAQARQLDASLRSAVRETGGRPVEGTLLGDGLLATFTSAREAIECASRCHSAARDSGLALHVGLHAGDVINEGNNVYGGAVNIAARVRDSAGPGETLVSATVRELARTSAGVSFNDRGEHRLKGIEEPLRLFEVLRRDDSSVPA